MKRGVLIAVCIAAAAGWAVRAHADLVTNGGFEDSTPLNGWTVAGDGIALDAAFPNNGCCDAAFGATSDDTTPGTLSQALSTTAGQSYILSFALLDASGWFGDTFTVTLGSFSTTITGDEAAPPGDTTNGYTTETFLLPASDFAGNDTLSFQGITDTGNFAPTGWNLDDVSVVAPSVPEPSSVLPFCAALLAGFLAFPAMRRADRRLWKLAGCSISGA